MVLHSTGSRQPVEKQKAKLVAGCFVSLCVSHKRQKREKELSEEVRKKDNRSKVRST